MLVDVQADNSSGKERSAVHVATSYAGMRGERHEGLFCVSGENKLFIPQAYPLNRIRR